MSYHIVNVSPTMYMGRGKKPVNGYKITFSLDDFGEEHELNVDTMVPDQVDKAIKEYESNRVALSKLGSEPKK